MEPIIEVLKIADVSVDPANLRDHPDRNLDTITASLRRFGPGRSIVLDGKNVVRAGNGTIAVAAGAGINRIIVIEPKPDELVAVRRPDWSPSEASAYSIADNRATDLSSWAPALPEQLELLASEGIDLAAMGFTLEEVQELRLEQVPDSGTSIEPEGKGEKLAKTAGVDLLQCKTQVEPGDIWSLGRHRLACLDVMEDWDQWTRLLDKGTIFVPYPSPLAPQVKTEYIMIMVQPIPYLCGIMIDLWNAVEAEKAVKL